MGAGHKHSAVHPVVCQLDAPTLFTESFSYVVFQAPDGTEHALYDSKGLISADCTTTATKNYSRGDHYVSPSDPRIRFVSYDGSRMTFLPDTDPGNLLQFSDVVRLDANDSYPDTFTAINGWLMMANGLRYRIENGLVRRILDRNGNRVDLTYKRVSCSMPGGLCDSPNIETITDPLKRTIRVDYDFNDPEVGVCDRITIKRDGAVDRYIKIKKNGVLNLLRAGFDASAYPFPEINTSWRLSSIGDKAPGHVYLPNGRFYRFFYNIYGEVARVELPTGGATEYDYGAGVNNSAALQGLYGSGQVLEKFIGQGTVGAGQSPPDPNWRPFIYRRLLERRVYPTTTSSTPEGTTLYSRPERATSITWCGSNPARACYVTLVNDGAVEVERAGQHVNIPVVTRHSFLAGYSYSSYGGVPEGTRWGPAVDLLFAIWEQGLRGYPDPFEGKEYRTEDDARMVELVFRAIGGYPAVGVPVVAAEPCQERVTVKPTNEVSGRVLYHDQYANVTDAYDYDYGSAPAISTQVDQSGFTHHVCPSEIPSEIPAGWERRSQTEYVTDTLYTADDVYLRHLPLRTAVYAPGATSPSSSTTYEYDVGAVESCPGTVAQLDAVTTKRGNRTKATRLHRELPSGSALAPIITQTVYDQVGNAKQSTDARSNTTVFSYADQFTNASTPELGTSQTCAFPTVITPPGVNGGTGSYSEKRWYDYYVGKPTRIEDVSGVQTEAEYNDDLDRLKEIRAAWNKTAYKTKTTFSYNDLPGSLSVTTKRDQYNLDDQALQETIEFDGLGRRSRTVTGDLPPFSLPLINAILP